MVTRVMPDVWRSINERQAMAELIRSFRDLRVDSEMFALPPDIFAGLNRGRKVSSLYQSSDVRLQSADFRQ